MWRQTIGELNVIWNWIWFNFFSWWGNIYSFQLNICNHCWFLCNFSLHCLLWRSFPIMVSIIHQMFLSLNFLFDQNYFHEGYSVDIYRVFAFLFRQLIRLPLAFDLTWIDTEDSVWSAFWIQFYIFFCLKNCVNTDSRYLKNIFVWVDKVKLSSHTIEK